MESEEIENNNLENVIHVSGMYQKWFLDYASYVILERAVPHINGGSKYCSKKEFYVKK